MGTPGFPARSPLESLVSAPLDPGSPGGGCPARQRGARTTCQTSEPVRGSEGPWAPGPLTAESSQAARGSESAGGRLGPTAPAVLPSNAVLGPAVGLLSQDCLQTLTRAGPGTPGHRTLTQEGRKTVHSGQPNALGSSQPAGKLLVPPGACPSW